MAQLPVDFWDDYVTCSTISLMPAHTLRAANRAIHLGAPPSSYSSFIDMAQNRYTPTDTATTYPKKEAWEAVQQQKEVLFTSGLCGMRFAAHSDWHLNISDVANGICTSRIETGPYPTKSGASSPTLLILTRAAKPQETLDDFVRSFLKGRYASVIPTTTPSCPSKECLAFEIVTKTMYQSDGGHFLVTAFASPVPEFPGFLFEEPFSLPKQESGKGPSYYRANERLHRLPGPLYSIVMLDSNGAIFDKASSDFVYLLKSMKLD